MALDDALAVADGVTPDEAAAALFGEGKLSEARLAALDRLGNRNGRYDLGDLLSWIDRCRRGEARCGTASGGSGPVPAAALLTGAAAGGRESSLRRRRRDPGRRGRSARTSRRAGMARYALAILLAAAMSWSCTGDLVGPPAAAVADPGFLIVEWTGPAASADIGVLLRHLKLGPSRRLEQLIAAAVLANYTDRLETRLAFARKRRGTHRRPESESRERFAADYTQSVMEELRD